MKNKNGIEIFVKPAPMRNHGKKKVSLKDVITDIEIDQSPKNIVGESIVNLNTHTIRVKNERMDFTWQPNGARPIIRYKHVIDPKAPGACILKTVAIDGLPIPRDNVLFIVNRDTITATRKLEITLRNEKKFIRAFKLIDSNPDNWVSLVENGLTPEDFLELRKYVNRTDLRAPGEQVRRKDNVISHCKELISEFE